MACVSSTKPANVISLGYGITIIKSWGVMTCTQKAEHFQSQLHNFSAARILHSEAEQETQDHSDSLLLIETKQTGSRQ